MVFWKSCWNGSEAQLRLEALQGCFHRQRLDSGSLLPTRVLLLVENPTP